MCIKSWLYEIYLCGWLCIQSTNGSLAISTLITMIIIIKHSLDIKCLTYDYCAKRLFVRFA